MSTKMTDGDWAVALEVFRASLPRRGDKGRNDQLFLEALHYFAVNNITWRHYQNASENGTVCGNGSVA